MGRPTDRVLTESSDAELLSLLRAGETEAYTELWRRHIQAALRVARRLAPGQADDLASESFLAVYHQVTVAGNGPEGSFRAYLFATIRNTAMSWHRRARLLETDPDIEEIELNDGLSALEDRIRSAEILEAFEALPERWQRVLWLTEVAKAKRPQIAAEFGIKPNAVSALHRRARAGLRLQWLTRQVPLALRTSPEHVAGRLPALLVDGEPAASDAAIAEHLLQCETCAEIDRDLRSSYSRMGRSTLAIAGFAALGVALPAAQLPLAAVGVGSAAVGVAAGAGIIAAVAAGVAVLVAGGAITAKAPPASPPAAEASAESGGLGGDESRHGASDQDAGAGRQEAAGQSDSAEPRATTGRGNSDAGVPSYSFSRGGAPNYLYEVPDRPAPAPAGSIPAPTTDPEPSLHSGIANPAAASGYIAPVLTGTTSPGAQVAIELIRPSGPTAAAPAPQHFAVQADAVGDWSFDTRAVVSDLPGTHEYRVWAFTDAAASSVDSGTFTLSSPGLSGFESLQPFELMPLSESSTTGIVFEVRGPANGTMCLVSVYSGQAVEIPLDAAGAAVKRLRLTVDGTYLLSFRACEGAYRGPETYVFVDVGDPDGLNYGWMGPDPTDTVFELSEP